MTRAESAIMKTASQYLPVRHARAFLFMTLLLSAGCTATGKDKAGTTPAAAPEAAAAEKSGYVDPFVSTAANRKQAAATDTAASGYQESDVPPQENGIGEAVGRETSIRANNSSIFSSAAPPAEDYVAGQEESQSGPVPEYIPPTRIDARRGSVFSSPRQQVPLQ